MTKNIVYEIFSSAIKAVDPFVIVKEHIGKVHTVFFNENLRQIMIIGFGKASYQMAKAVEESIETDLVTGGIIITKYGHRPVPDGMGRGTDTDKITVYEAGHPIPDENGFEATEQTIDILKRSDKDTLVVCLISGGGSALFVSPYNGITLREKQTVTDLLLKAGADINMLNTVRKHISKVKGGRLAEIAHPAKVIALIISDVIGDKLDVIASGPTAPDSSTFHDALNVIHECNLDEKMPERVMDVLKRGRDGLIPETPKRGNPVFEDVNNIIIGSNLKALEAAKNKAQAMGFQAEIISSEISGEAREVGKWLAKKSLETRNLLRVTRNRKKICLISGGETTVTVRGYGKGGRNTELALGFAKEIEGVDGVTLLSAGTDGTDGPTDAAGAIADGSSIGKAKSLGLNPDKYLENNDSYNFFKETDSLLITGPTGTNVMDVQIILVE